MVNQHIENHGLGKQQQLGSPNLQDIFIGG